MQKLINFACTLNYMIVYYNKYILKALKINIIFCILYLTLFIYILLTHIPYI